MTDASETLDHLAAACARRLPRSSATFQEALPAFESQWRELLAAVAGSHERFAFDLQGRPAAVTAVRNALPAMEAELFDAVLDDLTCELAAAREALYRVALAARGGEPNPEP
jgi:hypothetical protein